MGNMNIQQQDDKHIRLKQLARSHGISVNKLIKEFSIQTIAESDTYTRIQIMTAHVDMSDDPKKRDKLDA